MNFFAIAELRRLHAMFSGVIPATQIATGDAMQLDKGFKFLWGRALPPPRKLPVQRHTTIIQS